MVIFTLPVIVDQLSIFSNLKPNIYTQLLRYATMIDNTTSNKGKYAICGVPVKQSC